MKNIALFFCVIFSACTSFHQELFDRALQNGQIAGEGFEKCERFVTGWLSEADSVSGLIPRNLVDNRDFWNANAQTNKTKVVSGRELTNGYEVSVTEAGTLFLCISEK